jgi:hypothetical protein
MNCAHSLAQPTHCEMRPSAGSEGQRCRAKVYRSNVTHVIGFKLHRFGALRVPMIQAEAPTIGGAAACLGLPGSGLHGLTKKLSSSQPTT